MGLDATCKDTVLPVAWLMWTRKTILTRVFLRPMSVSPFLSSMSELRSLRIPAQSILRDDTESLTSAKHSWVSSICLGRLDGLWEQTGLIYSIRRKAEPVPEVGGDLSHTERLQSCQQKINTSTTNRPLNLAQTLGEIQTSLKQKTGNLNYQHRASKKPFAIALDHFCKTVSSVAFFLIIIFWEL